MAMCYLSLCGRFLKPCLLFAAVSLLSSNTAKASTKVVDTSPCTIPTRTVSVVENSVNVSYTFPEYQKNSIPTSADSIYYSLPGFGFCNEVGRPKLPMRVDTFVIPEGFEATISCSSGGALSTSCKMVGVEYPLFDNGDSSPLTYSLIKPYSGTFPTESALINYEYTLRGEKVAEVLVSPVKYNQQTGKAELAEEINYTLTYTPIDESLFTDETDSDYTSWTVYVNGYLNNALAKIPKDIGKKVTYVPDDQKGIVGYLIVTTDKYKDPVETFAYWKKRLGFTTHIISREKWSPEGLKSADDVVKDAIWDYVDSHYNVKYLLIVGDNEDVPSHYSDFSFDDKYRPHFTDSYFSTKDERSIFPDIYAGRIPVNNEDEARTVLSKIARLEMCPIPDEQFYKSAYHFATFQTTDKDLSTEFRRFVQTSEEILDYVKLQGVDIERHYDLYYPESTPQKYGSDRGSGLWLPEELRNGKFNWAYNASDVKNSFKNPQFYTLYRGHGSKLGWTTFKVSDLDSLERTQYPNTVFSIACMTGVFDDSSFNVTTTKECFAEELLKFEDGGASTVFAATQNSHTWANDCLIEGMIDAIWPSPGLIPNFADISDNISPTPEPTYRMGQILEQGLFRMNEQYGPIVLSDVTQGKDAVKYEYEIYHLFGDPSLDFFTEVPTETAPGGYYVSGEKITAGTSDKYSVVGLYNPVTGDCRRFEGTVASFYADAPSDYLVTTSGHNYLPYIQAHVNALSDDSKSTPKISSCRIREKNSASVSVTPNAGSGELELSVYDIHGRAISSVKVGNGVDFNNLEVGLADRSGVYIVILKEDGVVKDSNKIIK